MDYRLAAIIFIGSAWAHNFVSDLLIETKELTEKIGPRRSRPVANRVPKAILVKTMDPGLVDTSCTPAAWHSSTGGMPQQTAATLVDA